MVMVRQGYKSPSSSPSGGVHSTCGISAGPRNSSNSGSPSTEHLISLILAMGKWLHFDLQASEGNRPALVPCSEAPASAWARLFTVDVCGRRCLSFSCIWSTTGSPYPPCLPGAFQGALLCDHVLGGTSPKQPVHGGYRAGSLPCLDANLVYTHLLGRAVDMHLCLQGFLPGFCQ